jgi:hypothetical protein
MSELFFKILDSISLSSLAPLNVVLAVTIVLVFKIAKSPPPANAKQVKRQKTLTSCFWGMVALTALFGTLATFGRHGAEERRFRELLNKVGRENDSLVEIRMRGDRKKGEEGKIDYFVVRVDPMYTDLEGKRRKITEPFGGSIPLGRECRISPGIYEYCRFTLPASEKAIRAKIGLAAQSAADSRQPGGKYKDFSVEINKDSRGQWKVATPDYDEEVDYGPFQVHAGVSSLDYDSSAGQEQPEVHS